MAVDPTTIPFSTWQPARGTEPRGTILLVYGGKIEKEYRHKMSPLAEPLTKIGFHVIAFDYRSNRSGADFYKFGIHDRIEDTKSIIETMKAVGEAPFSILGLSMGGHIVVRAIAETDTGLFENVILIAPAAYPQEATQPGILFGPGEGRLREIIRKPNAWMTSDAFKSAEQVDAKLLLLCYQNDTIVRKEITDAYWASFGKLHERQTAKYYRKVHNLRGEHGDTLTNPEKLRRVMECIDEFTTPTAAR